ncbi:hydrolase [Terrimonas sp. NA20]|uniref:Hydrolase n=1 Tax=Terrimonas ginsenosidimutans TaxID=2908004 RepID=A0ABS9L0D4_9BACT|nr:hydrolase [Terrimonas ginsenosidimutans]MCG2618031.1 hydrolase [Terrimonas ginsenosidimutans]
MQLNNNSKAGLGALLTPNNSILILIDHQPFQFAGLRSHDSQSLINNVVTLAKTAKAFGVPTLLTTVIADRGGHIIPQLQAVFPDQQPIDRTTLNTWEDTRVIEWVKAQGKKKIIMAGLWTEICLAFPAIQAAGEGYEVYAVTDASGGVTRESHDMAVLRMVQAGVTPITSRVVGAELQRDWARLETVEAFAEIVSNHFGNVGTTFIWEQQLLNTPVPENPGGGI